MTGSDGIPVLVLQMTPAESAAAWVEAIDAAIAACRPLNASRELPADEPVPFTIDDQRTRTHE